MFRIDRFFDSYEEITPEILKEEKVKLLICDLDYTLAPKWQLAPTESLAIWPYNCLSVDVEIFVLSNNSEARVRTFCEPLRIPFLHRARKPMINGIKIAMEKTGVEQANVVLLGDRFMTDMLCANRAGIRAWRVRHRNVP